MEKQTLHPLGVKPKRLHDEMRWSELKEAIARRLDACMDVPNEWMEEYNALHSSITRRLADELKSNKEVCKTCNGTGMVQMAPNVRGLKVCPVCDGKVEQITKGLNDL